MFGYVYVGTKSTESTESDKQIDVFYSVIVIEIIDVKVMYAIYLRVCTSRHYGI